MKRIWLFCITVFFLLPGLRGGDFEWGAFDPGQWHGLVVVKEGQPFAFRFVIHRSGEAADGYDTFYLVERVGPFAADGSIAEVGFNPFLPFKKKKETPIRPKNTPLDKLVRLRYGRLAAGVVGQVSIPKGVRIETIFYTPWGEPVDYRSRDGEITVPDHEPRFRFFPLTAAWSRVEKGDNRLCAWIDANARSFCFYAGFDRPPSTLTPRAVIDLLARRAREYEGTRPRVRGEWQGLLSSISFNLSWMKLYQPEKRRVYLPAGRRWIFPGPDGNPDLWTIFEWDAFFNALEAVVEDPQTAEKEIEAVLDCQYPWGNIPNWRSARSGASDRSQPPVGAFAVLKTFYRTADRSLLEKSYDALNRWHRFWTAAGEAGSPRRDGNGDGLLEWGSDGDRLAPAMPEWERGVSGRQRAAWESGQDDLPNFDNVPFDDERGTMKMNCLDLSCLYALDAEMMMEMARVLGREEDARRFQQEYEALKQKINQTLWNRDFYYDRSWDGTFSGHKASSNFYPLIAGLPDKERVEKMKAHLMNKKEFWGEYVIPTISRDNPAFPDQQYWRGTIWPPTNYLIYQGLKRYGLDEIAAEFARKSASLFLHSWQTFGLCRENYDSRSGEGGGQRYQSWGPLFALVLLEDFIDICPFDGLRLGNLAADGANKIQNIRIAGHRYDLDVLRRSLRLRRDGEEIFYYKGRGVVRHLHMGTDRLEFEAHVTSRQMDFYPRLFDGRAFTLKKGAPEAKVQKKRRYIRLPQGIFKIVLKREK